MATMSLDQFYALEQTDKTQKRGLGDGLYGLILPKNKKSNSSPKAGKYFYWKNAKYEIRIGACKKFTEKQARKKVLEFQDCVGKERILRVLAYLQQRKLKHSKMLLILGSTTQKFN